MFEIEFTGIDLKGLGKEMKAVVEKHNKKQLIEISNEGEQLIKKRITLQQLPFQQLNKAYVQNKVSLGHSAKMFVRTGKYLNSIKKRTLSSTEAMVFVDPTARSDEGTSYTLIANVLEHGSNKLNIPPRPLWRTSLAILRKTVKFNRFNVAKLKQDLERIGRNG